MSSVCPSCIDRRWWHFVPSLLVWAGITWLSLVREVPVPLMAEVPLADKWGHMSAYFVFALILADDCYRARLSAYAIYLWAILLPIAYGGLIELIQPHFPPRQGEWLDWVADCIGVAIGVVLFLLYHLWDTRRKTRQQRAEL